MKKNHKKKLKEKKKLLKSNKWICYDCGFIGKPKKKKKGSWIIFFIKFAIVLPIVLTIICFSIMEGLLRVMVMSHPESLIWKIGFETFFPQSPYVLYSCPDCGHGNSMKKLRTQEGRHIFERFDRECFIKRT